MWKLSRPTKKCLLFLFLLKFFGNSWIKLRDNVTSVLNCGMNMWNIICVSSLLVRLTTIQHSLIHIYIYIWCTRIHFLYVYLFCIHNFYNTKAKKYIKVTCESIFDPNIEPWTSMNQLFCSSNSMVKLNSE